MLNKTASRLPKISMLFLLTGITPLLLIVSFGLCLAIIFTERIVTFSISPATSILALIKKSNPSLVNTEVDISFRDICVKSNGTGAICQPSLTEDFLKDYNITLYSSTNVSTNFLNVPQVAQDFNKVYLFHVRDLMYLITCLVGVLILVQAALSVFSHVGALAKVAKTIAAKLLKIEHSQSVGRWIRKAGTYLVVVTNIFYFFASVDLVWNLLYIQDMVEQTSLNILRAKVNGKFIALIWANLGVLLLVMLMKLVHWQVMQVRGNSDIKVDIIQPKI